MKKLLTSLNDIEIIKESDNPSDLIGYGALSQVRKARLKSTGKMYAVKEMDLKTIHPNDIKNITREIKTHIYLDHPNIVKLYDNYTSPNQKLYLLLEYCDNNNLFHFIQKSRLDEKAVHKFFYQTVQGIEYIHKRKIMHRDLKPENILLDKNFNVKVCDFGWCAEYNENERRQTFCGTNEYMAPEILDKQRQDFGIDIWALGILLYEMYHKKAPFTGRSPHDIAKAIKRRKLVFSASPMCPEAKDIIDKILQMDPKKRLTIDQFYSHPYFHKYPFFRLVSDDSKTIIAKNSRRSYVGGEERNEIVNTLARKSRAPSPGKANDVSTNGTNITPVKITTIKENAYLMNDSKPMIHSSQIVTMTKITTPGGAPLVPTFSSPTPSNRLIQSDWNIQKPQPIQTYTPQLTSKSGMNSGMNSLNSSQISSVMNNGLSNTTTTTNYVPVSTNTTAGTLPNMYSFSKQQTNMQINRESGRELQESSRDSYSGIIISSDTERVHSNTVQFSKPIQLNGNQTYPATNSYQPYKALQGTTYTPNNYSAPSNTTYTVTNGQAESQQQPRHSFERSQTKPIDLSSSQILTREYARTDLTPTVTDQYRHTGHTGFTNIGVSGLQKIGSPTSTFLNKPLGSTIQTTSSNWQPQNSTISNGGLTVYANQPSTTQSTTIQQGQTRYVQDSPQQKPAEWKYTPTTTTYPPQGSIQSNGTITPMNNQTIIRSDTRASFQKMNFPEQAHPQPQQYRSPIGSPLMGHVGGFAQTSTHVQQPIYQQQMPQYQPTTTNVIQPQSQTYGQLTSNPTSYTFRQ